MSRVLVVAVLTAPLVVGPAAPSALAQERMTLECGGSIGTIERTNGASWWGIGDDAVYTTKHLLIDDAHGRYEKSYGHVAGDVQVCVADHDVTYVDENGDRQVYESTWTVQLVRSR